MSSAHTTRAGFGTTHKNIKPSKIKALDSGVIATIYCLAGRGGGRRGNKSPSLGPGSEVNKRRDSNVRIYSRQSLSPSAWKQRVDAPTSTLICLHKQGEEDH